jgi:hypothetical protein
MFDENKQIWEIPKCAYQKYVRYDYRERRSIYEDVPAIPRKIYRLSTYYYKIQCQLTSYIREMFSTLYGKEFVYQSKLITDDEIRDNSWYWTCWLNTKGRKYSEKTIKKTDEIMNLISSKQRTRKDLVPNRSYMTHVVLETVNDVTVFCYYSNTKETFRQIYNTKTGKMDNFIWKNDKWQKSNSLSKYQNIQEFKIDKTYKECNTFDSVYLEEAYEHYCDNKNQRGYWYTPDKLSYDFALNYIAKPVIHQILQISNPSSRNEMYKKKGDISGIYGNIPNKGKTLYAKLGINKYQFDNPGVIVYVKWLLGVKNIAHIDNPTWDKYSTAFTGQETSGWNSQEIINFLKTHNEFSVDRWIKICNLSKEYMSPRDGYGYRSDLIKQLYKDYYTSLSTMEEFGTDIKSYPLLFNDKQQLQRYHDEAAAALSSVRNKGQDDKIRILYEKRLKMLENDGTHLIDMPKCSADLTREGSHLHHCVGGYVRNVADANTAIYFLRQASAPDTPWLTVEVRNKSCVQIHGACNAWMGSRDEYFAAVPFLVWWFEKHGITYNDNLLTNQATGYGSINSRREMPIAKIEQYKELHKEKKK